MSVKVNIFVAIIGSVLLPNNKFVTGVPTSRILRTQPPTYPEHNSPCNVVDDQPNVINASRTDSALDISERTAELISNIKAIKKYMSEHSKVLSILCEKKTTLPVSFDTVISERTSISDNTATELYVIYLEQLNAFASTIHNFNGQCTQYYDSDLFKQLHDFRQRIQITACAVEIRLREMGLHERNLGAYPVENITGSDCQSWSGRICEIYSFLNAVSEELNTDNQYSTRNRKSNLKKLISNGLLLLVRGVWITFILFV